MCASPMAVPHLLTHSTLLGAGNRLVAAALVRVLRGHKALQQHPCQDTPTTHSCATTRGFPTSGERRGLHTPPRRAPVVPRAAPGEAQAIWSG